MIDREGWRRLGQWIALGALVGVACGAASALFLWLLDLATDFREGHELIVLARPLAGLVIGSIYERWGAPIEGGNDLVIDTIHDEGPQLPLRMAPMVLIGTVLTHLFGGSAGREGTAVQMGASLADAMRKHPKAFDDLYTNMIAAGEAGGILDTILKRLATYIEKNVKLKAQVKGAMVYPVAVLGIAAIVIAVILWKVIPTFASMFAGLNAELPLPTRFVIALSNWFVRLLPFIVIGVILGVIAFRRYYATYSGRRVIDKAVLNLQITVNDENGQQLAQFAVAASEMPSDGQEESERYLEMAEDDGDDAAEKLLEWITGAE